MQAFLRQPNRGDDAGKATHICLIVKVTWTPHPVIVTIGDNRDSIRVL